MLGWSLSVEIRKKIFKERGISDFKNEENLR